CRGHRCTGAQVHRCRGSEVQRFRGSEVQRFTLDRSPVHLCTSEPSAPLNLGYSVAMTEDTGREGLLSHIALFESLTDEDLTALSQRVETVVYEPGEVIFQQGDQGSSLFVVG